MSQHQNCGFGQLEISDGRSMKTYYKLIRDKIPEIIQADGKTCITRILSDEEYVDALEKKLNEEVAEYQTDKNLEELADILEVLQAICIARGYTLEELETVRAKKSKERGGFEKKIFLERVENIADGEKYGQGK